MSEEGRDEGGAAEAPQSEEEFRQALEEEMRKARVDELIAQSVVGVVNLTARRIAVAEERDLDQARLGIDFARATVELLPEDLAGQVREALSQLQLQFASAGREQESPGAGEEAGAAAPQAGAQSAPAGESETGAGGDSGAGTSEPKPPRSSGLWTPPGSV